jgi:hypothetical protein
MNIIDILKKDYQQFPHNQTYSIYAENVYFQDPMNKFYGVKRYQQMIGFINQYFLDIKLELHHIAQTENAIATQWTLKWIAPVPWKPSMNIPGRSELKVNEEGLIVSHIDYWDISRLDVLKQLLFPLKKR